MDKLGILNKAFLKLGQSPISSLEEKDSKTTCALAIYDSVRDTEQASFRWTFCTKRFSLEALKVGDVFVKPAFGYKYMYRLPKGFIRLISINESRQQDYEIEGDCILTDFEEPLKIIALCVEQCEHRFPPAFVEVFATKLAIELCKRIDQDMADKNALYNEYMMALSIAKKTDAIQRAVIKLPDGPWLDARYTE